MALRIFILGGGRFGTHLAMRLCEFGCEVVIGDSDPKRVTDLSEDGFQSVEIDADDPIALKAADVQSADAVVVAIGENMQASIMATLLLKELGARKIIARAVDVKHSQVLEKLGADLVVLPSRDMAYRLAERLRASSLSDRLPLSGEYQLAHIRLGPQLDGQALAEARLPTKFGITVVLISREDGPPKIDGQPEELDVREPSPELLLRENDILIVTGKRRHIDRFEEECGQLRT